VAKTSAVQLLEVRPARAMGGKAFCSMTGDVSSVQAVVISRPHPDMYREVV
jgi:microcompartment protein CcmL/EutN